jgi:hypothetical protein
MVELLTHLFSLRKQSMRSIRIYRVMRVSWLLPLFSLLLIVNNIALALDWIFYPKFKSCAIENPVFVVSLPRTGTTNVLHGLISDQSYFSAMSMWEIILAPSIVQKKIFRWSWSKFPDPVTRGVRHLDALIFGQLNLRHKTGLFHKEEDDLILMWSFSSVYLSFFYPESEVKRDLFRFDAVLSRKRQDKIMIRYRRLVQRHLFALGSPSPRRFLSKNPSMAGKIEAVSRHFPGAKAVVIEREPHRILPSTEGLLGHLFRFATDVQMSESERRFIHRVLEDFRMNLQVKLVKRALMPYAVISFADLVSEREQTLSALLLWLGVPTQAAKMDSSAGHKSRVAYQPLSDRELEEILRSPWPSWPADKFIV